MPNKQKAQSLRDLFAQARNKKWTDGTMVRFLKDGYTIDAEETVVGERLEKWDAEFCLAGMIYDLAGFESKAEYSANHKMDLESHGDYTTVGDVFVDGTGDLKLCTLGQKLLCEAIDIEFPEFRKDRENVGVRYDFSFRERHKVGDTGFDGTENFIILFNDAHGRTPQEIHQVLDRALKLSKQKGL